MSFDPAPLSKTAKYKKITKPLLERKRRARINRCLDELKDLMVGALEVRIYCNIYYYLLLTNSTKHSYIYFSSAQQTSYLLLWYNSVGLVYIMLFVTL